MSPEKTNTRNNEVFGNMCEETFDNFSLSCLAVQVPESAGNLLQSHMSSDPAKASSPNTELMFKCKKCRQVFNCDQSTKTSVFRKDIFNQSSKSVR